MMPMRTALFLLLIPFLASSWFAPAAAENPEAEISRARDLREALSNDELQKLRRIVFAVPIKLRTDFAAAYLRWHDGFWTGMFSSHSGALEANTKEEIKAIDALWPAARPLLLLRMLGRDGTTATQLYRKLEGMDYWVDGRQPDEALAVRYVREWLAEQPEAIDDRFVISGLPGVFGSPFNECVMSAEDLELLYGKVAEAPEEVRQKAEAAFKLWEAPIFGLPVADRSRAPVAALEALGPDVIPILLEKGCQKHKPYFCDPYLFVLMVRLDDSALTRAAVEALADSHDSADSLMPLLAKHWLNPTPPE